LAQLLAHDVLPLVVGLERLVLHASAVATDGGAIAFAGASGSGKSTLAVRMAQRGCSLLTDDLAIVVERNFTPTILPMLAPVRLWPDTLRELVGREGSLAAAQPPEKRVLSPTDAGIRHAPDAVPLRALFLLDAEGETKALTPIEPRDAVAAVLTQSFVLATDDTRHATRMLEEVSRMVRAIRVCRLPPPESFSDLDAVLDSVLAATAA
jgi:hypothetical protein